MKKLGFISACLILLAGPLLAQYISPIEGDNCPTPGDFVTGYDPTTGARNCATPGGGSGAVSSVSNADGSLTVSPTTGAVDAEINVAHGNVWSATQTFAGVLGTVTTQSGTTYTLAASDCGTTIRFTNSSPITLTVPDDLVTGCSVAVLQVDAGQVTVSASGGATVVSRQNFTKTSGQWAMIGLTVDSNSGGSAAHYVLTGDGAT